MTKFKTTILALFFTVTLLGLALPGQAQYRVGACSGATHSTLQNAFNDLMTLTITGQFTIEICPGTYVDQPATLGTLTYSSSGGSVMIKKAPTGPGAVVLEANHPGLWTILKLDGSQNVTFDGIDFRVMPTSGRIGFMLVWLQNGAGEVHFENCVFDAYTINPAITDFSYRLQWSSLIADERDGDISLNNCHFIKGGTGVYAWRINPSAADSDIFVTNCWFTDLTFSGLTNMEAADSIIFNDNHLDSPDISDIYYGVESVYFVSEFFQANRNEINISNKDFAFGLADASRYEEVLENVINGEEVRKEFIGINLSGFTNESLIEDNTINYHRGINPETQDSSAIGIRIRSDYPATGSLAGTNWIKVLNNTVDLENFKTSHGIWFDCKGNSAPNGIYCQDNSVFLHGSKFINNVNAYGIRLNGNGISPAELQIEGNLVHTFFGIPPRMMGLQANDVNLRGPMTIFNNKINIDAGREYSAGILLNNITPGASTINYVGNNVVSMLGHMISNRGIYSTDVAQTEFHHNSINIHGSFSGTPGSVAIEINTMDTMKSYAIDLWNNILSNPAGGKAVRINHVPSVGMNDYNLLYNGTAFGLGEYGGAIANTLTDWQSLTGNAANSISANPQYYSNTDLHIYGFSPALQQAKVWSFPSYATTLDFDIDGETREPTGFREIGADEIADPAWPGNPFKTAFGQSSEMSIYPNPSNGLTNLTLPTDSNWEIRIFDLKGQEVSSFHTSGKFSRIDLQDQPAGIYLVQARSNTSFHTQKLILR